MHCMLFFIDQVMLGPESQPSNMQQLPENHKVHVKWGAKRVSESVHSLQDAESRVTDVLVVEWSAG